MFDFVATQSSLWLHKVLYGFVGFDGYEMAFDRLG